MVLSEVLKKSYLLYLMRHKYHISVSHYNIIICLYLTPLYSNIYCIIGLESPFLTKSDTSKINFIAPPISKIGLSVDYKGYTSTGNTFLKVKFYLKIKNQGTIECGSCSLLYHLRFTPLILQIFNPVSVSSMYYTQIIHNRFAD